MAQRKSGYARQPDELYETPAWVVDALAEHVRLDGVAVWEPCAASGQLAAALEAHTHLGVWRSDLVADPTAHEHSRTQTVDFLTTNPWLGSFDAIVTNPPFGLGGKTAVAFIERGLSLMRRTDSGVRLLALLLAVDFDSAKGRTALFGDCPEFALKIVLLKRIKWFEGPSGPSTNHAWFVWLKRDLPTLPHAPAIRYAPTLYEHREMVVEFGLPPFGLADL